MNRLTLTFAERAELTTSPVGKRLYETMSAKETNLCVALDETDPRRFLALAEALGPEIAVLKTHIDTLEGFTSKIPVDLTALAHDHNFLIFEDRKFADIGQTVKNQYTKGAFHIIEWADIVNAHALPGPGIIAGLRDEVAEHQLMDQRALLLLAQMSSEDNLFTPAYTKQVMEMAKANADFVIGFIGAGRRLKELADQAPPEFAILTPGIRLEAGKGDALGQTYSDPAAMIMAGTDMLVVGRDIYADPKPVAKARHYREIGWKAYQRRITASKVADA